MSRFPQWCQTNLGQSLRDAEMTALSKFLPTLHGDIAVQYAHAGAVAMLESCTIKQKFFIQAGYGSAEDTYVDSQDNQIQTLFVNEDGVLPLISSSVDLCLLSHMLDFADQPHQLLRESKEILVSGGHLVILGFNPYSLWGGRKILSPRQTPWDGNRISVYKMRDWLSLLDFHVTGGTMLYYSPLIQSQTMRQRFNFMEQAGDRWWPMLGSVYLLVAQKREQGMTVIDFRKKFKEKTYVNFAEPAVKSKS